MVSNLKSEIKLWDYNRAKVIKIYKGHVNSKFSLVNDFSLPDTRPLIVSGSEDKCVYLWDLQDMQLMQRLEGHKDVVNCVAAHPKKRMIVSGSFDKCIRVWENKEK